MKRATSSARGGIKIKTVAAIRRSSDKKIEITEKARGIPHFFITLTGISTADARTTATKSAIIKSLI
jgi:hypothetical protein